MAVSSALFDESLASRCTRSFLNLSGSHAERRTQGSSSRLLGTYGQERPSRAGKVKMRGRSAVEPQWCGGRANAITCMGGNVLQIPVAGVCHSDLDAYATRQGRPCDP